MRIATGKAGCLVFLILVGCGRTNSPSSPGIPVQEGQFGPGISTGSLPSDKLKEASGIVASVGNAGYLWVHNDSGDEARIFLIDKNGEPRATVWLADIRNRDWEDMAIGPGPEEGKTYLYVGDIGDNDERHKTKYIYRFEEPVLNLAVTEDTTLTQVETIRFSLPEGIEDVELLMIDPLTRDLFTISKRKKKVNLYRLPYPQSTSEEITAELTVSGLDFLQYEGTTVSTHEGQQLINGYNASYYYQIVAGDISHDGREVLIKSYSSVYYWQRDSTELISDLLKRTPIRLPYTPEPQGEAIAFDVRGEGYYTVSEERGKTAQQLFFYKRIARSKE